MVPASPAPGPDHHVTVVDGPFMSATCTCGWRSAGRRQREAVRQEAQDHLHLYEGEASSPRSSDQRVEA